jgi:general stress protein 26
MATPKELEQRFWKALKSDRTIMLGLSHTDRAHMRPMTAQFEDDNGPLWIFTSIDHDIVQSVPHDRDGVATFVAKDHDLFAALHGPLAVDNDRAVIDRLWNRFVAAWYEGGKSDPKLALLRFDVARAEIWENTSSLMTGAKALLGINPQKGYSDKVAEVKLN